MSDKRKMGVKDQSKGQQMTQRQQKAYQSAKVVSLLKANDLEGHFTQQELIQIESVLRDELHTNQWMQSVCKAVTDEAVFVTQQQLDTFNEHQSEGKDVCVTEEEVRELDNELQFAKERAHVLQFVGKDLTQKLSLNESQKQSNSKTDLSDSFAKMRIKLGECLEIMKSDLNSDLSIEEPKRIADEILSELNEKLRSIDAINSPNEWLSEQLDELALSDTNERQLLDAYNSQLCVKLQDIRNNLMQLDEECRRIKRFYEVDVYEDMSWRSDLNIALKHLQNSNNGHEVIRLDSGHKSAMDLVAKQKLIDEYCKVFGKVKDQEFDEFRAMIEALKQRVDLLAKS